MKDQSEQTHRLLSTGLGMILVVVLALWSLPASASATPVSSVSADCSTNSATLPTSVGSGAQQGSTAAQGATTSGATGSGANADSSGGGVLAFTGMSAESVVLVGVLVIGAGTFLVISVRRRKRRPGAESLGCFAAAIIACTFSTRTHRLSVGPVSATACSPSPVLPETHLAVLLPVIALLVFSGFWIVARRRSGKPAPS